MTVGITELPPEGMQLPGVSLAGDAERGTKTTEGISLLFTTAGITVQGPQPQIERLLVWTALDSATCHEAIVLSDGRNAVIMELTSGGQAIRFLLPAETVSPGQAAYLDQALPTWLARYKGLSTTVAPARIAAVAPGQEAEEAPVVEPILTEVAEVVGVEVGVTLPAPGPAVSPAPSFAAAGATVVMAGAAHLVSEGSRSKGNGSSNRNGSAMASATRLAPPPPAPAPRPTEAPSPPPSSDLSMVQSPPAPPLPASAPSPASSKADSIVEPPVTLAASATAWDDPPLGDQIADEPAPAKKSRFALARRKPNQSEAPGTSAVGVAVGSAAVALNGGIAPVGGSDLASAPVGTPPVSSPTGGPPLTAPIDPVPLAVQPPPPTVAATTLARPVVQDTPVPPVDDTADASTEDSEISGVVLADPAQRISRGARTALVLVAVMVVLGGITYVVTKKSGTTAAPAVVPSSPALAAAADTALAGSINLQLADLPAGWTVVPPAQAVVRPPVAPAVAQADATNTMAACLNTSYAVISGLFDAGSLPDQTSLVQSPTFQSAAGSTVEMASKTTTLGSPGQVQALDAAFSSPKFAPCYQQYVGTMAAAAVAGSTAQVQSVTLNGPPGVQTYGVVTTYTVPGAGTEVVGAAYILGGRVLSVVQPSTNGPVIPVSVFTPAFDAVAARVAANSTK